MTGIQFRQARYCVAARPTGSTARLLLAPYASGSNIHAVLSLRRQRRRCYSRSHWYINKWAQANPFRRIISTRSSSLWRWREGRHGLATRSGVGGDGALPVGHLFSNAKPVVDFGVREFHALMFRHLHPGERTRGLTHAISACRTTTNINLSAACSRKIWVRWTLNSGRCPQIDLGAGSSVFAKWPA
jgi:hypothetical protein